MKIHALSKYIRGRETVARAAEDDRCPTASAGPVTGRSAPRPRQCGKTTLARSIASDTRSTYFDLEDPDVPLRGDVAKQVLAPLRGLVVLDEFQRQPALFELIRVLADRRPLPARFLILGSASPDLVRGASETLAGRVALCELGGLESSDVGTAHQNRLWLRGGFPRSFLARSDAESAAWRADFVTTVLERDVPQLGVRVAATALRRFWTMLAHYHGQIWNAAELARSLGVGETAVRHYLDILSGTYLVRQLPPWFANVGKRLVKSPKVFVRDAGILHQLLGIRSRLDLHGHPKLGASGKGSPSSRSSTGSTPTAARTSTGLMPGPSSIYSSYAAAGASGSR